MLPVDRASPEAALTACSFCGQSLTEVKELVTNERVSICDACVGSSNELLEEAAPGWTYGTPYPLPAREWPDACSFCGGRMASCMVDGKLSVRACERCIFDCNQQMVRNAQAKLRPPHEAEGAPKRGLGSVLFISFGVPAVLVLVWLLLVRGC
jgi:ribosomal protein L24E